MWGELGDLEGIGALNGPSRPRGQAWNYMHITMPPGNPRPCLSARAPLLLPRMQPLDTQPPTLS